VLEALIGAGALATVPLSSALERLHPWLFERLLAHPGLLVASKAALAFLSLAFPTFCMGGTLPVLARLVDRGQRRLGLSAGFLYVANTAGAAFGALCVPFALLPAFGAAGTLRLCVAGNLAVALVAWRMDRSWSVEASEAPVTTVSNAEPAARASPARAMLVYALLSGVVSFVLQVLWNRAFAQVHENSVYSFALIVAVFVFALALGAQVARSGLRRSFEPEALLGWAWLAAGVFVAASPWLFLRLSNGLSYVPTDGGWSRYAGRLALMALGVVFPSALLVGVGFPAIMERAGRASGACTSDLLGRLLAVNVAGCVAGALVAGFVLPRVLGLWRSFGLTSLVLVAAGGWALASAAPPALRRRLRPALLLACAAAAAWPLAALDLPRVRLVEREGDRLLALSEGTHGIVAVLDRPDARRLKLNNYYVLGGTVAAGDERMQTHLPLLLHPAPRRVAVLGLGTGISAGGALFHPIESVTAVELVPEVVAAAATYFRDANAGVVTDERTRVVVDDARSYLLGTSARFDVVVGDLVVPWRLGEGSLLTQESFAAARRTLAPGGVFCQWLPLFQLSEAELQILLRTFVSVFPSAQVWRGDFSPDEPALALVGGIERLALDPAAVLRRLREMRPDPLNQQLVEPAAFWMHFVGELRPEDLPAGDARINSEQRPWVELIGPRHHAGAGAGVLFTGRRLQAWEREVAQRSIERFQALGPAERSGIEAGDVLLEFALALSERDEAAARTAHTRLRGLLPPRAFDAIFPPTAEER
jgi:spermidine synthase